MKIAFLFPVLAFCALALVPRAAQAQTMTPFTDVIDVCPVVTNATFDEIKLKNGTVIYARIAAENPTFLCLERFGEQRAVGREHIASVQHRMVMTQEERASFGDQILFTDDSVLCGKITEDNVPFRWYDILVPGGNFIHTGFKSQVKIAYQNGKPLASK